MNVQIAKARQRMIADHPFYACLLYRLQLVEDAANTPTMATDGKSIFFNPAWVDSLTVPEVAGVLAHECAHIGYGHHLRKDGRDHKLWNQACDYAINEGLIKAGFTLPDDGLFNRKYRDWAAERIYSDISKPQQDEDEQDGKGADGADSSSDQSQDGEGDSDSEGPQSDSGAPSQSDSGVPWGEVRDGVDEDGELLDESGKAEEQRSVAAAVNQAAQAERKAGQGSLGQARDMIDSLKGDSQPWNEILRDALRDSVVTDQTYSRPNRRLLSRGLVLPSNVTEPTGELVVAVDTSCSLDDHELSIISHHIDDIVADIKPTKVYVVYCDFTINHVDEFDRGDDIVLKMHGGGGTAFNPPFNWCEHNDVNPNALVYFTDGLADVGPNAYYGEKFSVPDYPVFWLTNFTDPQFDGCEQFGEIIKI